MKYIRTKSQVVLILLKALILNSIAASPIIFPTGVTIYNPEKAYNCFVIFSAPDGKTHLIDMNGNEVRQWPYSGQPSELLDPKITGGKPGHVLLQLENGIGSFNNKVVGEVDWEGNIIWQWGKQAPGGEAQQHHDWYRLSNGNTLILVHVKSKVFSFDNATDDAIYEVTRDGTIVWKWVASEHISEYGILPDGIDYLKKEFVQRQEQGKPFDYLHINDMHVIGDNHWFKSGDIRFHPDNIIIDSRNANFVAIIDKQSGTIVWRLGPNFPQQSSQQGGFDKPKIPRPVDQISGQHDAHIIAEGLPGAGNLLLFDNQGGAGYPPVNIHTSSRILEINPTTQEIVWEYKGDQSGRPEWSFYSHHISSARRLPNGNTLIDEGMNGRIFQVTPAGEIVWEYVSPYTAKETENRFNNWVYRAQPVPYEWVPEGTPHSENAVEEIDISKFRVSSQSK